MVTRRSFISLVSFVFAAALNLPAQAAPLPEVTVFAAASTTDAINEIGALFEKSGQGKIVPSYASSSTLARQIENGAPAQLFISADEKWANYLDEKKLLSPGTRSVLLGNRLALIAPKDSRVALAIEPGFPLAARLGDGRLSVGDPDHVPVGLYTKEALEKLGVWKDVEGKLARGDSVRAALAYVGRGECPLGIVYTTDAAVDPNVRIVTVFPENTHTPITYPVALIKGQETDAARNFLAFLKSDTAKQVFERYGFATK